MAPSTVEKVMKMILSLDFYDDVTKFTFRQATQRIFPRVMYEYYFVLAAMKIILSISSATIIDSSASSVEISSILVIQHK